MSKIVSAGSAPSPDSLYRILTAQSGLSVHHSDCNLVERKWEENRRGKEERREEENWEEGGKGEGGS